MQCAQCTWARLMESTIRECEYDWLVLLPLLQAKHNTFVCLPTIQSYFVIGSRNVRKKSQIERTQRSKEERFYDCIVLRIGIMMMKRRNIKNTQRYHNSNDVQLIAYWWNKPGECFMVVCWVERWMKEEIQVSVYKIHTIHRIQYMCSGTMKNWTKRPRAVQKTE